MLFFYFYIFRSVFLESQGSNLDFICLFLQSLGLHYFLLKLNYSLFLLSAKARKLSRIENLKRRPTKRPDWNELMKEIESVRNGVVRLRKTQSNDRSQPVLSKVKVQGQVFLYGQWLNSFPGAEILLTYPT